MRPATPGFVTGAGVVGIFSGAGVFAYRRILSTRPTASTAVAR